MRPRRIVEVQIAADKEPGFGDAGVDAQVDFLVLHRPLEPLDEDVVAPGPFTEKAGGTARLRQRIQKELAFIASLLSRTAKAMGACMLPEPSASK